MKCQVFSLRYIKEDGMNKGKAKSYSDVLNTRLVRVLEQILHEKEHH